jgi:hypothetical protein
LKGFIVVEGWNTMHIIDWLQSFFIEEILINTTYIYIIILAIFFGQKYIGKLTKATIKKVKINRPTHAHYLAVWPTSISLNVD